MPACSLHPGTYQQPLAALIGHPWRLERGAGCPPRGPSPARSPSCWLQHQHRCASIHRQSKLDREERHQERRDWWGGHVPAPGLPLPPGTGGACQAGRSPVPACRAHRSGAGRGHRARGWVGWWKGLFLLAPTPSSISEPHGTHTSGGSQVFPNKQLKIYPVWTDVLAGSWLPASRQVGVGGHGQERGPPELSPSESWSRSGCSTRQHRDWALNGASAGLSCRAGHRWETIAFCPGASRARAAQGRRAAGLCQAPGAAGQGMGAGSCLPCPYPCPILGLLRAPGEHRGLTSPGGTAALAKHQFDGPCDSTGVCRSHTSTWCPYRPGKDPWPPPRVPNHCHHHHRPSTPGPVTRLPWVWSNQQRGMRPTGREHGQWR